MIIETILRKIFEPKKTEGGGYEIISNREINALLNDTNIVATFKSYRLK